MCWGPAGGDQSLLPTSPRNLGDNWLHFFLPDGWKVLARMKNNLSGVGIHLAGAFWIKQSLCREVAEPQWPLQDLELNSGSGTSVWFMCWGMSSAPPSCSLCCQNTRIWPAGKQEHQSSSLFAFGLDLRAVNVLCSGVVVVGICQAGFLLRRKKKDGIVCKFGCQLHCGVNSCPGMGQQQWEGSSLRKCVLGRKGILCKRAWRCQLPGKAQTTAGSAFTFRQG